MEKQNDVTRTEIVINHPSVQDLLRKKYEFETRSIVISPNPPGKWERDFNPFPFRGYDTPDYRNIDIEGPWS